MRFTSQHKAINQKEYGKAVSPLRFDSLALILSCSIFVVYGKQSEKNKYICSSKRHSALHTFWDTTCRMAKERRKNWNGHVRLSRLSPPPPSAPLRLKPTDRWKAAGRVSPLHSPLWTDCRCLWRKRRSLSDRRYKTKGRTTYCCNSSF